MAERSVADGRLVIPPHWPKWRMKCQANRKRGGGPCTQWAIIGMPTCKYHGSGGEVHRNHGQLRYMAWIVLGGPKNMPVETACRLALAVMFEMVFNQGIGTMDQQLKAAMWITDAMGKT